MDFTLRETHKKFKIVYRGDIFEVLALFLTIPLFSDNAKQEVYSSYTSKIIDIKINEKCLENKIFTGFISK